MSTTINTSFTASEIVLTCNIGTIEAETDAQNVSVTLVNTLNPSEYLLMIVQYPYNGKIQIFEIGRLIEQDLSSRGLSFCSYKLMVGDASLEFTALCCRRKLLAGWITNNFLTALPTQIMPHNSDFSLQFPETDNVIHLAITFRDTDGRINSCSIQGPDSNSDITECDYLDLSASVEKTTGKACKEILIVNATSANRSKTIFFADREHCHRFTFRNCFNAFDDFYLCGSITESTKVDSESAVCNGIKTVYDRSVSRSYKFNTGVLSETEAEALAQLVESNETYIYIAKALRRIVFTGHSLEFSDDNASQRRAEFTFEMADGTPLPPEVWLKQRTSVNTVFTDQFEDSFL